MPQPRPLGVRSRYTPADALRMLYARLQGASDPAAVGAALVAVLADILGDPPVALLRPDAHRGGYVLRAGAGLPAGGIDVLRVGAEALPPRPPAHPSGN